MKGSFYGYLLSFFAILIASFIFLFGLAYWNAGNVPDTEDEELSTCITSSGEAC